MSLQLPSLPAFRALPRPTRAALFARWVAMQEAAVAYVYGDNTACPLAQFGRALTGTSCWAGGSGFVPNVASCKVLPGDSFGLPNTPGYIEVLGDRSEAAEALLAHPRTFGGLTARLSHLLVTGEASS
jgi:hypothetical protein